MNRTGSKRNKPAIPIIYNCIRWCGPARQDKPREPFLLESPTQNADRQIQLWYKCVVPRIVIAHLRPLPSCDADRGSAGQDWFHARLTEDLAPPSCSLQRRCAGDSRNP